ncbi:hypothetical protein HWV62_39880 [Athelia sp. TMB]|nr:hypothetical protein HWV62_39880 [Athelia sp. TMB]
MPTDSPPAHLTQPTTLSPWAWLSGPVFPNFKPASTDGSRIRSRKLWSGEVLFAKGALLAPGRADLIVRATLSLPILQDNAHERVRAAVRTTRWNHPSIASRIAWNDDYSEGKFVYEAPSDDAAISAWLDQVVFLRHVGVEGVEKTRDGLLAELASSGARRTGDEFKLYHIAPSSSGFPVEYEEKHEIVMHLRHALFDGIAGWEALSVYLAALATALDAPSHALTVPFEWGAELERLARPVPDRVAQEAQWSPDDLHGNWPLIQKVKDIIARPGSNYGIPYPIQPAKQLGMSFKVTKFPSTTLKGLLRAARAHGVKLFATQFATNLIACMRAAPPPPTDSEHSVTLPFNAVDLRRLLSTPGQTELVSALGFNTLDARDLMRFRAAGEESACERVILDAVWTLAGEIQAQLIEQSKWDKDFVKSAPVLLGTVATWLKNAP